MKSFFLVLALVTFVAGSVSRADEVSVQTALPVVVRTVPQAGSSDVDPKTDKRTCVVKVKLEPGQTYAIWLNSEKFENFKDADGRSAVPYLLAFQTAK
jgi:RNA polymerase sigma-70 factor (ECF subfamily)